MNVLHPPFVHFVVALPVAAFFSQITYLVTRETGYSKAAFRIIAMTALAALFALYTGMNDAQQVIGNHQLPSAGLAVLAAHKTLGITVVLLLLVTAIVKWRAVSRDSIPLEKAALILIVFTLLTVLYQGRQGGTLVYQYGGGIATKVIDKR